MLAVVEEIKGSAVALCTEFEISTTRAADGTKFTVVSPAATLRRERRNARCEPTTNTSKRSSAEERRLDEREGDRQEKR